MQADEITTNEGYSEVDIPWLYEIPLWADAVLFLVVLFVAVEIGFRFGLRQHHAESSAEKRARGDVTLGSMLALLGLMLAFTYAFTLSRADARKQSVVEEANAIGTAFLKADLLPEPGRSEVRERLLDYARTRVVTRELIKDPSARQKFITRTMDAQSQLWPATKRALQGSALGPYEASMVQAVNDVLDAHTRRLTAAFDHMPEVVSVLLLLIAALSLAVAAHNAGLSGRMNRWRMSGFTLILAALMLVILDFDRPQVGFIMLNETPLSALVKDLENALAN
jgi:hypothetical protein